MMGCPCIKVPNLGNLSPQYGYMASQFILQAYPAYFSLTSPSNWTLLLNKVTAIVGTFSTRTLRQRKSSTPIGNFMSLNLLTPRKPGIGCSWLLYFRIGAREVHFSYLCPKIPLISFHLDLRNMSGWNYSTSQKHGLKRRKLGVRAPWESRRTSLWPMLWRK